MRGTRVRDIADGTSVTAFVGEVFRGKDFFRTSGSTANLNGRRCYRWIEATGYCEADASVPPNHPDRDQIDWSDSVAGSRGAASGTNISRRPVSSAHEGGVHVLMGDGAVKFLNENVDLTVWGNTITRNGQETDTAEF
jgi:hypothetical protein